MRSPISNTFARYENAERRGNQGMVKNNKVFFDPWETIHESNRRKFWSAAKKVALAPFLIMQGALDDNVCRRFQENSSEPTRPPVRVRLSAVRKLRSRVGRGAGSSDDKAREVVKEFIARQLKD